MRGRGRGRRPTAKQEIALLRRELRGLALTPRFAGPPKVNLRPWYPLVVERNFPNALVQYDISTVLMGNYITIQLGLTTQAAANIVFKLKEVRLWATQQGNSPERVALYGEVGSLVPTVQDAVPSVPPVTPAVHYPIMYKFRDTGSLDEPAAAGWKWPISQQETVLYRDSPFVFLTVASNVNNFTGHFHLQWSTAEVMPPTARSGRVNSSTSDVSETGHQFEEL